MKVVIATDSFKGCLSSLEAGSIMKDAILNVDPDADIKVFPLADGGEGTVESLMSCMKGHEETVTVTGPLGEKTESCYGIVEDGGVKTAVMEMANVAGITMLPEKSKNPMNTTTYGVGEMILDATKKGCREFIIGIGGSATNDGGMGMLEALGVEFFNAEGRKAGIYGRDVLRVARVNVSNMAPVLKECHFTIMCDVTNPLCGEMGASYIYGPQKGATEKTVKQMDEGLANYAAVIKRDTGKDHACDEGAGAAGGLGFAFMSFFNTSIVPGISFILDKLGLDNEMTDADLVVTGEGKLDAQTAMGKAPAGVAKLAKKHGAKVIAFTGQRGDDASCCNDAGMDAYFGILGSPMTTEEAMDKDIARANITATVEQVFRLMKVCRFPDSAKLHV